MDRRHSSQFRLYSSLGGGKPPSLLARVLASIAGVAVFVVAIVAGGVLLLAFFALAAAVAAVLGVRLWWWQRRVQKSARNGARAQTPPDGGDAIEGEFHEIDER